MFRVRNGKLELNSHFGDFEPFIPDLCSCGTPADPKDYRFAVIKPTLRST
jgi:hypothetical protein